MVCKEDVVTWFKESSSYKRIDLMCSLLNMCLPFELRFLGTCVEDLGKRDFHDLREAENRANNLSVLSELQSVSEKRTRRSVAIYLSLLHSSNHACSNALYRILANFDYSEINTVNGSVSESDLDVHPLDELLLLYTMALNHPAFTYEQKSVFGSILLKLQEEENKLCLSKNVVIYMNSALQVGDIDPTVLTCGGAQYLYVQPASVTAIPVSCAPERKLCGQASHEAASGSQVNISRNGPTAPQSLLLAYLRPNRYPLQHTRQQHHPEDSLLQVGANCRSVPSPSPSPTHSSNPSEDSSSTPLIATTNPPTSPPLTSSPTVVSARVHRRRQQSASPGVGGESVEGGEGPPRVSRGHRGGSTSQRRPSPRRHQVRTRGSEQAPREVTAKEIVRYGSQLGDAEEQESEETVNTEPVATENQLGVDLSDAQHMATCLTPTISSALNESIPSKGNDAVHLGNSSPPITTSQMEETPLVKNRLCMLEGDGSNLLDGRTMPPPQALTTDGGRPEASLEEDSEVQSMQWVRAALPSATATAMAPRQPCLPHTRPSIQRAFPMTSCSSGRGSGADQGSGVAPVPSSPSSAFSSSSSLSLSSSSSSSSGVSPQPPPPPPPPPQVPPPPSSVPYSPPPPQVPPPFLPPHHHLLPPPHHHALRFPTTTFGPGFLSASGGTGAGSGGGSGGTQTVGGSSYLPPGSGGTPMRHSFPFAPNGLPPADIMYATVTATPPPPQYHAHSGHHPRVGAAPTVLDHSAPPPLQQPGYPPYIPVLLTSRGKGSTCYNCGGHTHRGVECRELTMEEITRPGSYRLEYSRQKGALVGSMSGGGPGGTTGGGETGGVVDE